MLTSLNKTSKVVGTKETIKAIEQGQVARVYLAQDVDQSIKEKVYQAIDCNQIELVIVESKLVLGRACGIDVAAASAALLK